MTGNRFFYILVFVFVLAIGLAQGRFSNRKKFNNKLNYKTNGKSKYANLCNKFSYFNQNVNHDCFQVKNKSIWNANFEVNFLR
jgi:hypothetical protein